jgi:hypothetical protein
LFPIVPFWKIFSKLGFSKWLSLGMLVPVLSVIILFYVAFADPPQGLDTFDQR